MAEWWKKLALWKALGDTTIYVFLIGFFTGTITQEFYSTAILLLIPGLIANIVYLVRKIGGKN